MCLVHHRLTVLFSVYPEWCAQKQRQPGASITWRSARQADGRICSARVSRGWWTGWPYTSSLDVRNSSAHTHTAFLRRTVASKSVLAGPLTLLFVRPKPLVEAALPYRSSVSLSRGRDAHKRSTSRSRARYASTDARKRSFLTLRCAENLHSAPQSSRTASTHRPYLVSNNLFSGHIIECFFGLVCIIGWMFSWAHNLRSMRHLQSDSLFRLDNIWK